MANLTTSNIPPTGTVGGLLAADVGGDAVAIDNYSFVEINNASGSPINVTLVARKQYADGTLADQVIAIPASQRRFIWPDPEWFEDPSTGRVNITYSAVASVTVRPWRVQGS